MKVLYDRDVEKYLNELIDILYDKGYFGFKESAYQYVDSLIAVPAIGQFRQCRAPAINSITQARDEAQYIRSI